jgi:hypothetical protein
MQPRSPAGRQPNAAALKAKIKALQAERERTALEQLLVIDEKRYGGSEVKTDRITAKLVAVEATESPVSTVITCKSAALDQCGRFQ